MKPNKQKRKLHKSDTEKISPLDKKTKTFKTLTTPMKMASIESTEHCTSIPNSKWKELMDKVNAIGEQTEEISEIKKQWQA